MSIRYWKEKLNEVAPLQLPLDHARPAIQSTRGAIVNFQLNKQLSAAIQSLSQQQGTTLFMTLLATIKVLLYKYSGQQDICVGSPIAGRQHQEVENLIGFFINTIALRTEIKTGVSFTAFLQAVKDTTLEAYAHQELPFEKVVETVVKDRDLSRSPLFQVMFILQNTPEIPVLQLGEVQLTNEGTGQNTAKYELSFNVAQTSNGLQGTIEYCTDLFNEQTICRMIGHLNELLQAIVQTPRQKIELLPILSKAEEDQLVIDFNNTAKVYPGNKTITDLFEEQVTKTPDAIAVLFEEQQLSYRELDERSNQLAHWLVSKGIGKESLVPICIERGTEMIIGLLAVLKAGAAYVPVDPEYPEDRIRYMLEDTGATILLSSRESRSKITGVDKLEIIELDSDWPQISKQSVEKLNLATDPHQLAYVIYTSGSTGKPKGVMIEHTSVVNLLMSIAQEVDFKTSSLFMSVTTFSFDICYLEFFMPLVLGGKLVVIPREEAMDGFKLAENITRFKPTHMQGTPSTWQLLLDAEWQNKEAIKMLVGGEAVKEDLRSALTKRGDVWNVYGPTETTIWSTIHKLSAGETVLIGAPIANNTVQVVNKEGQLVPVGVAGEILIGGVGLARGYYKRPDLTAEKFVANKFGKEPGSKMYRTGDLGRWLPGGKIECLGRIDEQVKIRGYRIELGEIETILQQTGLVRQSVVLAREDKQGNKRLVGYIIPEASYNKAAMLEQLRSKLPEYMIPALWMELENLPLTPNGKINKKALPDPDASELTGNEYVAPRNEMEAALAAIWQELLGVERVGIYDNFFELGGHSLLAMRLVTIVRKTFDVEVAIKSIFSYPSIATFAGHLAIQNTGLLVPSIKDFSRPLHIPLSFSQERLWFIHQMEGSTQYHLPAILRLKGTLNREALKHALHSVVERHESLRSVIYEEQDEAYQKIISSSGWKLSLADGAVYKNDREGLSHFIRPLISKPFDLTADYLLRATLIKLDESEYVLVVTMHHIASDGWSLPVIIKEVAALYASYTEGRSSGLSVPEIQYADYAIWQRNYLQGAVLENKIGYWKDKLSGVEPVTATH
jgi:amino acid adenylation domain-containing protein